MSEKRFTYKNNKAYDNLTGEFHSSNMVSVNVLNELNDTLLEFAERNSRLSEENEQLRQSRNYWSKKTKEHIYYWNCLEKAIEKTFDSDDQCFDEIWKHYDEMEAKWEDE